MLKRIMLSLVFCIFILAGVNFLYPSSAYAASIGSQIRYPESGWTRYDDLDSRFVYPGGQGIDRRPEYMTDNFVNNEVSYSRSIKFTINSSRLRIVSDYCSAEYRSRQIAVYVDGQYNGQFSQVGAVGSVYRLLYQVDFGEKKVRDIEIRTLDESRVIAFDAIDIDSDGQLINPSINLNNKQLNIKSREKRTIGQTVVPAIADIDWKSDNEDIAVVDKDGVVRGVSEGSCNIIAQIRGSEIKDVCKVTVQGTMAVLDVKSEVKEVTLNDNLDVNVSIQNINDITLEDMTITYDSSKLNYLGTEAMDGVRILKNKGSEGSLKIVCKGAESRAAIKTALLKLRFQAKAPGNAYIKVAKADVSNGKSKIKELSYEECGENIINIK